MIVAGLHMIHKRAFYIDFLPPLLPLSRSMFISKNASIEVYQFQTYFGPFKPSLWLMISISVILIAMFKLSIQINSQGFNSFPQLILIGTTMVWTSMKALFGGKSSDTNGNFSSKSMVLIWSFSGTIIWICYRSQLTAIFSASYTKHPFNDFESLAETNWR